jgi:hypothetical protein
MYSTQDSIINSLRICTGPPVNSPTVACAVAACSALPQLVWAGLDDATLLLRGCLSSPRAAAARLRPAVDQCVWARNRATSRRFQRRWRRKRAAALARSTAQWPAQHPHFRGPDLRLAVVAKVRHPAASPVPPIIERNRGTPELRRTPDSCGTARSLSFSRNHSLTAPDCALDHSADRCRWAYPGLMPSVTVSASLLGDRDRGPTTVDSNARAN